MITASIMKELTSYSNLSARNFRKDFVIFKCQASKMERFAKLLTAFSLLFSQKAPS